MAFIRCGDPRKEQCNENIDQLKESLLFIFLLLAHAQTFDRCVGATAILPTTRGSWAHRDTHGWRMSLSAKENSKRVQQTALIR